MYVLLVSFSWLKVMRLLYNLVYIYTQKVLYSIYRSSLSHIVSPASSNYLILRFYSSLTI